MDDHNCSTCGGHGVVYHEDMAIICHCVEPHDDKDIGGEA